MKRSNRLILLIGVLLAIVAFVGVILLSQDSGGPAPDAPPTELPTVYAAVDIPLGTEIEADMLEEEERLIPITQRDATAFSNNDLVLGEIARRAIPAGKQLTAADFASSGAPIDIRVPEGLRAIAVQVDQITGVGTLIKTGDYVDMVIGLSGEQFPVITINPEDESITVVTGVNNTSVKLLIEGMQVLGTLLPPAAAPAEGSTGDPGTALTGQQEIVILAVTPQQAEQIKFAEMTSNVSLILRAAGDFRDPITGEVIIPAPSATTGVILRTLVDEYGVLVPELVEAILPSLESPAPEQ